MRKRLPDSLFGNLHINGSDLAVFLLSLLLAFSIWLVHNLTQRYSAIMNVTVVAESNIEGRSGQSTNSEVISARCRATGFRVLNAKKHAEKEVKVFFPPAEFSKGEDDIYILSANSLASYISEIFGDDVQLESFVTKSAMFHFPEENHKKVAVTPRMVISYRPQYTSAGEMQFYPDSVVLYGEPRYLESIDRVFTKPLELKLLKNDVHGEVNLELPAGVRSSDNSVNYSLQVTRFVEVTADVKLDVQNIPPGKTLSIFPSSAKVTYMCAFPMTTDPSKSVSVYIDYNDFSSSINGRCVARTSELPASVLSYSIEPQIFECVEE